MVSCVSGASNSPSPNRSARAGVTELSPAGTRLENSSRKSPAPRYWGGGPPPKLGYKADWRAVVAFLASHTDLSHLSIAVNMGDSSWPFVEDTLMWPDQPDLSMFRFIYDIYIDIVTALCSLKGLGDVTLDLSVFEQLKPWLGKKKR